MQGCISDEAFCTAKHWPCWALPHGLIIREAIAQQPQPHNNRLKLHPVPSEVYVSKASAT